MALQTSGPISLNNVAGEFGGSTPHSLSEYYGVASGVPSSGTISLSNFYGKSVPAPDPEPEPDPGLTSYTLNFGGAISRQDFDSEPAFGGTSYTSAYSMGKTSGSSGGVAVAGLFTQGIGDPSGNPADLADNDFNRIYMIPGSGWNPFAYSVIRIDVDGGSWTVNDPVWSRYTPPGTSGFSNNYYLSNSSSASVSTIGYRMAKVIDAGGGPLKLRFIS